MLRAITVRAPWATAIALGGKRIENRTNLTTHRGEFAVHAGKTVDQAALRDSRVIGALGPKPRLTVGAIVAVAVLVDCHRADQPLDASTTCCEPWGDRLDRAGRVAHHLVLANVRALPRPVPCRGQLFIGWPVPADVEAAVRAQLVKETSS